MLKQQVQLLQQELQQIHQYGNIRILWNNIFSKLETITFTSQQPLKIYQQLMFRQSISQDQIKPEHLSQDAECQTQDDQIKFNVQDTIKSCISSIKIDLKTQQEKLSNAWKIFSTIQNTSKLNQTKKQDHPLIHLFSIPTTIINLSTKENYIAKPISNLEYELKDSQINDLKKQNQALKQDIQKLQLIQNQLSTQLEEKEAKLKLLNFMVLNHQQQKSEFGFPQYDNFRL
ncbi:unnamed protein product (macronuclear) [Paramecium tetraurelia]|uniref:Uncharacterized protein n=1 Tax=Paramecium tetraurelia TaxID=5888 RepID=A0BS53_PARTE|nr:uncharacterized protein GSPATT00031601001 [Paramecium tetraurelia]CAK61370.1 unnamed protein product [Paramecium tetraurelia]|eukprot:XP_001428768.1 hypothetical protein (macronuclear) [Paramecium tetraurelia strain d4-2]